MPELPEVEVLVRHLAPLLRGRKIRDARVHRPKIVGPSCVEEFRRQLRGATFTEVSRRGKYLLFDLRVRRKPLLLVGHLGMTGRMYLLPGKGPLPKHTAVSLDLGRDTFVFEDTRYFGRLTLDGTVITGLGPEPLGDDFVVGTFAKELKRSSQAVKVKLLDQSLVAGVGNIYASEALFRAGISPRVPARKLKAAQVTALWQAIRDTLTEAIECGSTVPLNYSGNGKRDGLFYFGRKPGAPDYYEERLQVYDRAGEPCVRCGGTIKRIVQGARSTFFCSQCQRN